LIRQALALSHATRCHRRHRSHRRYMRRRWHRFCSPSCRAPSWRDEHQDRPSVDPRPSVPSKAGWSTVQSRVQHGPRRERTDAPLQRMLVWRPPSSIRVALSHRLAELPPCIASLSYDFFFCCRLASPSPGPPPFSMNSTPTGYHNRSVGRGADTRLLCMHPHRGRDSSADGASAFLYALSHQLLLAGLRRFRCAVFRREPKPDAGRRTVCKLNTGSF